MISLVKRLRNHHHNQNLNKLDLEKLCKEAANRIEELENHYNASIKEIENLKKKEQALKRKNTHDKNVLRDRFDRFKRSTFNVGTK